MYSIIKVNKPPSERYFIIEAGLQHNWPTLVRLHSLINLSYASGFHDNLMKQCVKNNFKVLNKYEEVT